MQACDTNYELMNLYLDGDLSAVQESRLEAHLAACQDCTSTFEAMLEVDVLFRAAPMFSPDIDLSVPVVAAIEKQDNREKQLLGMTLLVGGAMSLIPTIVVLIGAIFAGLSIFYPGTVHLSLDLLITVLSAGRTLGQVAGNVVGSMSPWLLPSVLTITSLAFLVFTWMWASRYTLRSRSVRAYS